MQKLLTILLVLGNVVLGVIAGLGIGATIGGNFFVDFEAFGVRGYEATGWIGILVGGSFSLLSLLYLWKQK